MLSATIALQRTTGIAIALALGCIAAPAYATNLQEVYDRSKIYDATMQSAVHEYEAAKWALPLARSAFRPQLGAGADLDFNAIQSDSYTSSQTGDRVRVPSDDDQYGSGSLSLTLSQTIYNRANTNLVDQARIGVMQADSQFLAVEQQLILRVSTAYFNVLRAQANVDFSRRELEAIGQQREQAERRFDVGLVPITDVRSAQAQYDLAIAQEIAADNQLSTSQEALRVISGIEETGELAPLAEDLPLKQPEPANIDTWVETAGEQNLNLVIARLSTDSARSQVTIERSARYPTLEAVGTAARIFSGQDDRPGGATSAEIGLQLRVPVLTGGRVNALIAQANARALSSAELLVAEERAATQQTRDAFRGVTASISRAKALGQALVSTEKSAEAAQAGFRAGTRTSVEVLQALRDVYSSRSDYIGARYDYIINTLNLKAAAGTLSEKDVLAINRFLRPVE